MNKQIVVKMVEDFIQLIRYGLIGILGLIVDFGIYSTLTLMTEMRVELANLISSSCGLINNFLVLSVEPSFTNQYSTLTSIFLTTFSTAS